MNGMTIIIIFSVLLLFIPKNFIGTINLFNQDEKLNSIFSKKKNIHDVINVVADFYEAFYV